MKVTNEYDLQEPETEDDCWFMTCELCVWWGGEGRGCTHPELWIDPEQNKP